MGMYTEVFFRAEVVNLPNSAIALLKAMSDKDYDAAEEAAKGLDHEFFGKERWGAVFYGSSAYFEADGGTTFKPEEFQPPRYKGNDWVLQIHSSLKNYSQEADSFFDWIRPYLADGHLGGGFIGYTLYEEADSPILYFADGSTRVAEPPEPEIINGIGW